MCIMAPHMKVLARLCPATALLVGLIAPQPLPVAASAPSVQHADPTIGPHALDEARHAHDLVPMAPIPAAFQTRRAPNTTSSPTYGGSGLNREVFGFAPYWALAAGSTWDYSLLTTVAYFGLDANADGTINDTTNGWQHWANDGNLTAIITSAHTAGDRVVVTVKAFQESTICSIVMSDTTTQAAIDTIIKIGLTDPNHPVDGVNIDFEGNSVPGCPATTPPSPYPTIQAGFTHFMTQLTAQVHARLPSDLVSVDTYSGSASWDGGIFNIGQLGAVVDAMFTMNYDMYGNIPGQAAPNAPMNGGPYNDALTVSQYVSKAPASKVILGVPYYGYKWSTTGPGPYAQATSGPSATPYTDVLFDLACAQQLHQSWDYTAQEPWASWWSPLTNDPCGGNRNSWRELYYDNAGSLGTKYDLVNSYNLRGAGMWALGYDGGAPELWAVLKAKFGTSWPGQYQAVTPTRILDTRNTRSPIGPGTLDVPVAGVGPVPSTGATAVVLNVTVTQPSQTTYVTLYPTGSGRSFSSNLNLTAGRTEANLVEVALGLGGKVTVFNAAGFAHLIFDVAGYVTPAGGSSTMAGRLTAVAPARLFDTRDPGHSRIGSRSTLRIPMAGRQGLPAGGMQAVALNLTVTNPTMQSFLTAYPTGTSLPGVSNLNFSPGETRANRAIVPLGADGSITLYNRDGFTDAVVDVTGWFADATATGVLGGQETVITPVRIADTRLGLGAGAVGPGKTVAIQVAGMGPVPAMSAPSPPRAVILNVTVTDTTAPSFVTVYPSQLPRPGTSDINFVGAQTVPNLVVVKLGADGMITVYNAMGATNVIVDVLGWFS